MVEHRIVRAAEALLASPRFAWTLSIASISVALLTYPIQAFLGAAGLVAMVAVLTLLSGLTLVSRRAELNWQLALPLSLLAFLAWSGLSLIWSQYQVSSLGGIAAQWAFALIGLTLAVSRDSIQIVRAFGDCLRVVIGASLAVEVLAGVLIDSPIRFLGVAGNLAAGGPIQGVVGTRNQLGLIALVALITFAVELRTKSVTRMVGVISIVAAGGAAAFTQSPVVIVVSVVVGIATAALAILRRVSAERRIVLQSLLAAVTVIGAVCVYLGRTRVIDWLNAASESEYRIDLWRQIWELIALNPLEGWGWIGTWNTRIAPFFSLDSATGTQHRSALNGYLDVWLQLGAVGVTLFVVLVGLTFVRAWILASRQQSSTAVWGALVMVALIAASLAESEMLTDVGWLILVVCSVRVAQQLSWRGNLPRRTAESLS